MCDALVASGSETQRGRTVFAKNSDRKQGECQPLLGIAAAQHAPGTRLRCTHLGIPQAPQTHAVLGHSPWWVWGFEHGVNEHAVAIGNLTVFSREPVEEQPGLIGMDLVRLGLERGASAREALQRITDLIEAHGQGGAALAPGAAGYHNAFLLADPEEAWLLQTSGRRWAAARTTRDALSNHLSLGTTWELASDDLTSLARDEDWWTSDARIDVAAAYRNPHVPGRISDGRLRRSRELLARRAGRIGADSMIETLRDHLAGGPVRLGGTTPEDEDYYTLCMHSEPIGTTTASLVAELPADRDAPWPVWISFATPCTGLFLPVYVEAPVPFALAQGGEQRSDASGWWAFAELQAAVGDRFEECTPRLRESWKELESRIEAERPAVESEALARGRAGEPERRSALLADAMERWAELAIAEARALTAQLG